MKVGRAGKIVKKWRGIQTPSVHIWQYALPKKIRFSFKIFQKQKIRQNKILLLFLSDLHQ